MATGPRITLWHPSFASSLAPERVIELKSTDYFRYRMSLPDRRHIREDWVMKAIREPLCEAIQSDGRVRRWARIDSFGGRYLRVILLPDGETVHNAFFDRDFTP